MSIQAALYTDKDVARRLNMSASWVRGQRHKRRHGHDHVLDIDPVMIGSCPRYVGADVEAFLLRLVAPIG